jgi:exosortase/archaeosortase family protein
MIGLMAPGGRYLPWLDEHLNYIKWLRTGILKSAKFIMQLLGYKMSMTDEYTLYITGANGIRLVYSCLGIGVMSFWIAFVTANKGNWKFKLKWVTGGLAIILISNITRISVLLAVKNARWRPFLNIEHHTFYNMVSYTIILLLIFFFIRKTNAASAAKTI